MCNASDHVVGVVLGQQKDKKPYVIYYTSKTLDDSQWNYATIEEESLVVIYAIKIFNHTFCATRLSYTLTTPPLNIS